MSGLANSMMIMLKGGEIMGSINRRHSKRRRIIVARGCYCGALCTCYNAQFASAVYNAVTAASWSSADVGI